MALGPPLEKQLQITNFPSFVRATAFETTGSGVISIYLGCMPLTSAYSFSFFCIDNSKFLLAARNFAILSLNERSISEDVLLSNIGTSSFFSTCLEGCVAGACYHGLAGLATFRGDLDVT